MNTQMDIQPERAADTREATRTDDVKRRTIIMGAAWSLPVIAAAVAVPMASASPVATKSDLTMRWHNFSPSASIPASQGSVKGNLGFGVEWSESTELVTITYRVVLEAADAAGDVKLTSGSVVLGRSMSKDNITFSNTSAYPLTPGKTYHVVGYISAVDASGKIVDVYDVHKRNLLPAWDETFTAKKY